MGLFDWLKGEKKDPHRQANPNQIWVSEAAKFRGIEKFIREPSVPPLVPGQAYTAMMLVAFFKTTFERLTQYVDSHAAVPVEVIMAEDLVAISGQSSTLDTSNAVLLLGAEIHPSWKKHKELLDAIERLPFPTSLQFYLSLDDPALRIFDGTFVRRILEMGGFDDDNPLESTMVAKRIVQAQKKNDESIQNDHAADSAEAWIEINMP